MDASLERSMAVNTLCVIVYFGRVLTTSRLHTSTVSTSTDGNSTESEWLGGGHQIRHSVMDEAPQVYVTPVQLG